jgi:hypothetical protein
MNYLHYNKSQHRFVTNLKLQDLRVSRRCEFKMVAFRAVVSLWAYTNVSEKHAAAIFMVESISPKPWYAPVGLHGAITHTT